MGPGISLRPQAAFGPWVTFLGNLKDLGNLSTLDKPRDLDKLKVLDKLGDLGFLRAVRNLGTMGNFRVTVILGPWVTLRPLELVLFIKSSVSRVKIKPELTVNEQNELEIFISSAFRSFLFLCP